MPDKQGFPDARDLDLQRRAELVLDFSEQLVEWIGEFSAARRETDFEIHANDEFKLLRLRRLASNLWRSTKVPVAAAAYGASQVGKSLFVGQVLTPSEDRYTPLGQGDKLPRDAYIQELSFNHDLNPQNGAKEATALVTRFTTKDRFDQEAPSAYPVKVRALSRSEWLRVVARGHQSECVPEKEVTWTENTIAALFEDIGKRHPADEPDREWRMDLLDVYSYVRSLDHRLYAVEESMFNGFLSRYPLTDAGCVELAGRLFWNSEQFPALTTLFNNVNRFLKKISAGGRDGMLVHWAAVRFLLDSQRSERQESPKSEWKQSILWTDLTDRVEDGWYVIDYQPGAGGPSEDLATIQSAMIEMIVPVVPERLGADWREVINKIDILDLPGMRAEGSTGEAGATSIETLDEQMNVVKRGKVFYLISRYIEERQVQTFLLLISGRNLEVKGIIKEYLDKWGRARYGEDAWPLRVDDPHPALFIGLTGIDDEFKERNAKKELYDARLTDIISTTLYEIMTDFGGPNQPFTNIYPLRYPGSWDADLAKRKMFGEEKWGEAKAAFLASEMVQRHVRDAEEKWDVAMRDGDGGLSLIAAGLKKSTSALQKQDALQRQIEEVRQELRNLAQSWWCDPNSNLDREKRLDSARTVLDWLQDENRVYDRVLALESALCFREGDAMDLAEFAESRTARQRQRPEALNARFPKDLKAYLQDWAKDTVPKRWREHTDSTDLGAPWIGAEEFAAFARYLGEYLCSEKIFPNLAERLLQIVNLKIADEGASRHAKREYVLLILNDYATNPGPDITPLDDNEPHSEQDAPRNNGQDFGLMKTFVHRWRSRLPTALASAAGEHTTLPAGNVELHKLLQ